VFSLTPLVSWFGLTAIDQDSLLQAFILIARLLFHRQCGRSISKNSTTVHRLVKLLPLLLPPRPRPIPKRKLFFSPSCFSFPISYIFSFKIKETIFIYYFFTMTIIRYLTLLRGNVPDYPHQSTTSFLIINNLNTYPLSNTHIQYILIIKKKI
jgi:hypothetical protein